MSSAAYDADVVIIGSGVMGGLIAAEMAKANKSVIVLEAGPRVNRRDIVETFRNAPVKLSLANAKLQGAGSPYPSLPHAPSTYGDYLQQVGPVKYNTSYLRVVGGTTWHFGSSLWRMLPNDFRLNSLYGRGRDWPISYDGLADQLRRTGTLLRPRRNRTGRVRRRRPGRKRPGRRSLPAAFDPLPDGRPEAELHVQAPVDDAEQGRLQPDPRTQRPGHPPLWQAPTVRGQQQLQPGLPDCRQVRRLDAHRRSRAPWRQAAGQLGGVQDRSGRRRQDQRDLVHAPGQDPAPPDRALLRTGGLRHRIAEAVADVHLRQIPERHRQRFRPGRPQPHGPHRHQHERDDQGRHVACWCT